MATTVLDDEFDDVLEDDVQEAKRPLPPASSAPKKQPPRVVAKEPERAEETAVSRGGKSSAFVVANPEKNRDFATTKKPSLRVVANDDDDDDDDTAVAIKPNRDARIEIASRKRGKGTIYIIRWRWQMKDADGSPLRTASGGYKRGSSYVTSVTNAREAKNIGKRLS